MLLWAAPISKRYHMPVSIETSKLAMSLLLVHDQPLLF